MTISATASTIYKAAKKATIGDWSWRTEWSKAMKMAWGKVMKKSVIDTENKWEEKIKGAELNGQLQHQLSNGSWVDIIDSRINEFLELCERQVKEGIDAVVSSLNDGKKIRNSSSEWYSNCRIRPEPVARHQENRATIICKRCRQTGHAGDYPFSTFATSHICDDCL